MFLNSDDRLEPECLAAYAASLLHERNYCLLGKCRTINDDGQAIETEKYRLPSVDFGRPLTGLEVISAWPSNWACLLSRELVERAGGYNCELSLGEDYDLNVRLINSGAVFLPLNDFTYQVRLHAMDRLTVRRSREQYDRLVDVFRRTWNSRRIEFMLRDNRQLRLNSRFGSGPRGGRRIARR